MAAGFNIECQQLVNFARPHICAFFWSASSSLLSVSHVTSFTAACCCIYYTPPRFTPYVRACQSLTVCHKQTALWQTAANFYSMPETFGGNAEKASANLFVWNIRRRNLLLAFVATYCMRLRLLDAAYEEKAASKMFHAHAAKYLGSQITCCILGILCCGALLG
jgi:hypothetical protein